MMIFAILINAIVVVILIIVLKGCYVRKNDE